MVATGWLVTGISSGFGRLLAERLLARGDRVAGTVRDPDSVADLRERHGDRLWLAELDLEDTGAIRDVVDRAFAALGRIEVVVSNAGYGLFGAAEEFTDAQVRHQLDVNLLGSIQLVRCVLPHLRAQNGGRILQLSSVGGQAAFPGGALYHATKWGIEGFLDAVAQEVAPFNISCALVEPGGARTDFRFRSARLSAPMAAYDGSPARNVHRMLGDPANQAPGDPALMAERMIELAGQTPMPRRLALGSDAFGAMRAQLRARLEALEAQEALARSTDLPR
jgi:NAD(P)-dependent dehydrogenase (short-subunit alcohol dehydrogenase family)